MRYVLSLLTMFGLPVAAQDSAVAVVKALSGQASVRPPAKEKSAIAPFDWLNDGDLVEVQPNSKLTIILQNGNVYELGSGARATVSAAALKSAKGAIRQLPSLPPIPKTSPLADSSLRSAGAMRIRGTLLLRGLYPKQGAAALADAVTLSFQPLPDANSYRVEVRDDDGNILFQQSTQSASVPVPPGRLRPGVVYSWRVQALDSEGVIGAGNAVFATLKSDDAAARAAFATAAQQGFSEKERLSLLAEIDHRLGLLAEAKQALMNAQRLSPNDESVQRLLSRVETALASGPKE